MADSGNKILLVEDNDVLVKVLRIQLERDGFSVASVDNGVEAVSRIREEKPDLVILDLMVPGKNGFEILEELKSSNDLKKIPVAIMSNLGQEEDLRKGKKMGAVDYIVKSEVSFEKMVERIKGNLAKAKK